MIRREVGAEEFWLIAQDDHARISGKLAEEVGNGRFAPLSDPARLGVGLHDAGWPIHDDSPTVNARHVPIDVFESHRELALHVWDESATRAGANSGDYPGLLVSLHGLWLSAFATGHPESKSPASSWNIADARARFEVNRFQHKMIEIQESLRQRLGMRTDRPLANGLAGPETSDPKEKQLLFDFRWLQALDRLSLSICCTAPPFESAEVYAQPGGSVAQLKMARAGNDLTVHPWPFKCERIAIDVPFRRLPAQAYRDDDSLRRAYVAARVERFTAVVRPFTI